jgi:hypothetical protein
MDQYEDSPYHQLDPTKRQFRLVRLLRSALDHIQCELNTFSLLDNDVPQWKALSYRWGDDQPEFVVYLEDQAVSVRKTLHAFMTEMVTENRRDWIFIDALCINQDDESEKPCQVVQMAEIYRRAEEVVTWIVYEPCLHDYNRDQAPSDPMDESNVIASMSRAQLEKAVLENSYWSRLWILQEVLLAKALTIRIGSAEVAWTNLVPEKTIFERRGPPIRNESLSAGVRNSVRTISALESLTCLRVCQLVRDHVPTKVQR